MAGSRSKRSFRARTIILGAVVIVISALVAVYAINSAKGLPFTNHTQVQAKFTDIGDTRVNADLREADYRVGRVNAVNYEGDGVATLQVQFDDNRPVYKNASLQIVSRSGLGQKYVNINRGDPAAGLLEPNGVIPAQQNQANVEILDLTQIFDPKTTASTQNALTQLGSGLEGNGDALSEAVDAVPTNLPWFDTVVNSLNNNGGQDVNRLLGSLRNLSSRFQGRQQQLTNLNRQIATTFDAVNADNGQAFANLVKTAPGAFQDVRKALIDVQAPLESTRDALVNIRPGVRDLVAATPDLRGVLREAPRPLDKIPGVSRVGQPALAALTPALHDLRPVVPLVRDAALNARVPLDCLKRYDIGAALGGLSQFVQQGDQNGNWARFFVVPADSSIAGPITLPQLSQKPFPMFGCPAPNFDSDHWNKPGWGQQVSWGQGGGHK